MLQSPWRTCHSPGSLSNFCRLLKHLNLKIKKKVKFKLCFLLFNYISKKQKGWGENILASGLIISLITRFISCKWPKATLNPTYQPGACRNANFKPFERCLSWVKICPENSCLFWQIKEVVFKDALGFETLLMLNLFSIISLRMHMKAFPFFLNHIFKDILRTFFQDHIYNLKV